MIIHLTYLGILEWLMSDKHQYLSLINPIRLVVFYKVLYKDTRVMCQARNIRSMHAKECISQCCTI